MKYKGKVLLLDNFRVVLKDFSVDIQDVVRSAIMDGVDIELYIDACKNNPYRLDQIRLGIKEGINKAYFDYESGNIIYGIRKLLKKGVNLAPLTKYRVSELSNDGFMSIVNWCGKGYDLSKLNLVIIPDNLLDLFGYGLSLGVDVSKFNNGVQYPERYLEILILLVSDGFNVDKFLMGNFRTSIIEYLSSISKDKRKYNAIYNVIRDDDSIDRLINYEKICSMGKDLTSYAKRDSLGKCLISDDSLAVLVSGLESGIDLVGKLDNFNTDYIVEKLEEEKLKGRKLTSGRLIRRVTN